MPLVENKPDWVEKLGLLSPEVKEMFFKYNSKIISLGLEITKRDNSLNLKRNSQKIPIS